MSNDVAVALMSISLGEIRLEAIDSEITFVGPMKEVGNHFPLPPGLSPF